MSFLPSLVHQPHYQHVSIVELTLPTSFTDISTYCYQETQDVRVSEISDFGQLISSMPLYGVKLLLCSIAIHK